MSDHFEINAEIFSTQLESVEARIEALNKRAEKLGVGGFTLTVLDSFELDVERYGLSDITYTKLVIQVTGAAPVLDGWRLAAVLKHEDEGTLILTLPGMSIPAIYRDAERYVCDHCQRSIWRKETFVVRHTSGEYRQLGRTCLQDFVGDNDTMHLIGLAEHIVEFEQSLEDADMGGMGFFGQKMTHYGLTDYLSCVACSMRLDGWTPRTNASGLPTASAAWKIFLNKGEALDGHGRVYGRVEQGDVEKAKAAIAWAQGLTDLSSEYVHNLHTLASDSRGIFPAEMDGFVASMIQAHGRAVEAELTRQASPKESGGLVGKVGETFEAVCELVRVIPLSTRYGTSYLHKFVADGSHLAWFSSSASYDEAVGQRVKLVGKVKGHGEYDGMPQTTLTRCKVEVCHA